MANNDEFKGILAEELTAFDPEFAIQEEEVDGVKKTYITGRFIRKNFLSSNGIFYPEEIVDAFVEQINAEQSPSKTMLTNHFAPDKTLAIVGKLISAWKDANGDGFFKGVLADTLAAEEIKKLVRGNFLESVSLRARPQKIVSQVREGKQVKAIKEGEILGIDFTPMPGIEGASIDYMTYEELLKEVTDMNMEELKTQLAELQKSLESKDAQIAKLQEELATVKDDIKAKETSLASLEEEKKSLSDKVAELTEEVKTKDEAVKESEEKIAAFIDGLIKESKEAALAKFDMFKDKKIYTFVEGAINGVTVEPNTDFSKVLEEARTKLDAVVTNFSEMLEELTPSGEEPPKKEEPEKKEESTVEESTESKLPKNTATASVGTRFGSLPIEVLESIERHTGVKIAPEELN